MKVRIIEVCFPKCGPRHEWSRDGAGVKLDLARQFLPDVMDIDDIRDGDNVCECGEPVLIATEPVEGDV